MVVRPDRTRSGLRGLVAVCAIVIAALAASAAKADEIKTSNPYLKIRWDNTIKYSLGLRLQDPSDALVNTPPLTVNLDDGDRNFAKGLMQNRIDLLSEFDITYKGFGVRLSGAGWYDTVYNTDSDNTSPYTYNPYSVSVPKFATATRDLAGRKAEVLDAFAFGRFRAGSTNASFRIGRHALQWGESLFFGANGIAGTQSPTDILKLLSVPNAQFKEVIRPVNQVSGQLQFSPKFTIGGYYQFEWERNRLAPAGSYFSFSDTVDVGAERLITGEPHFPFVGPPSFFRSKDLEAKNGGQFGVQMRTRAAETDFGFYFIRYHDKSFNLYLRPQAVPDFLTGQIGTFQLTFGENIKTVGASMSHTFGAWNVAGEVSGRFNTPLVSDGQAIPPIPGLVADNDQHPFYAVGNSLHAQVNWLASFGPSILSKESNFLGELAWNTRTKVTANEAAIDPNTSKSAFGMRFVYEPMYRQVASGLDISVPVGLGYNPKGNSSVISVFNGGQKKGGDFNIGLAATFKTSWKISATYTTYLGKEGAYVDANSHYTFNQFLKDRDYLSFSIRTTF